MTKKIDTEFQQRLSEVESVLGTVADELYTSAASAPRKTYRDAVKYLKQMDKLTYSNNITDDLELHSRQTLSIIVNMVIRELYQDANSQKVQK
ncbi:hypothetical protein [Limosilactobacillus vaginalis]|uniref:Uncharacterized protein n=1 Tax=Limosilactobacillus vaginalis DSM 5837 = ATCC 49540 TaxID=1423814 RepID=C2ERQ7_9LACO|nr:hypothetical protein [Limosilactobacillus vaginalis]EEJ41392.1 hypothetical protein HMPREF0549_0143 [Limosilactobacillus vaginalis DSM 5837 = ATCC 49540]QFS34512.1 hypothetical protein LV515_06370 [Limosilactobacillus vaginalis]